MIEKLYKCTLVSDVVLNSRLATEGNVNTLDYISGSNFIGIVADAIYHNCPERAYDLLHSDNVMFGDAQISETNEISYAIPFSLFKDKYDKQTTWVQYKLDKNKEIELRNSGKQLKQERTGYFSESGNFIKEIKKTFSLKSAQNRAFGTSADGKMFGMDAIDEGQSFVFTIKYKNENDIAEIEKYLLGDKSIGKSKTAQYGQVKIEEVGKIVANQTSSNQDFVIVYAASNLCFFNEFGHPTYQPTIQDLGLKTGEIIWEKSQIRTHSYSNWNFKRATPNAQRCCILKGSVFYIENGKTQNTTAEVGEYLNEGLGRVLYNPKFLTANEDATWAMQLTNDVVTTESASREIISDLGQFLKKQCDRKEHSLAIATAVHTAVYVTSNQHLKRVSPSQWGEIRAKASNSSVVDELRDELFDPVDGFLVKGVSAEKYWDKHQNRENFQRIFNELVALEIDAVAKYAAEMAKEASKFKNSQS